MKIFECGNCAHPLYFENESCEKCGHLSGYYDDRLEMLTFKKGNVNMVSDRNGK